jgi:biopolymer transport protein TolR
MNRIPKLFLVALTLANGVRPFVAAQTASATHKNENSPQTDTQVGADHALREGVSVQLPFASHAVAVPQADDKDSLILTVTDDGQLYVGIEPISGTELVAKVKNALSSHTQKTLYLKADGRTPYVNLVKILDSVRTAGVERLTLLTDETDAAQPGILAPPKGLELLVDSPRPVASLRGAKTQ